MSHDPLTHPRAGDVVRLPNGLRYVVDSRSGRSVRYRPEGGGALRTMDVLAWKEWARGAHVVKRASAVPPRSRAHVALPDHVHAALTEQAAARGVPMWMVIADGCGIPLEAPDDKAPER